MLLKYKVIKALKYFVKYGYKINETLRIFQNHIAKYHCTEIQSLLFHKETYMYYYYYYYYFYSCTMGFIGRIKTLSSGIYFLKNNFFLQFFSIHTFITFNLQ